MRSWMMPALLKCLRALDMPALLKCLHSLLCLLRSRMRALARSLRS
jgi:hypothetical protein